MPLIEGKSNEARSENIATEIAAGKSPERAAAIAYSIQRKHQNDDTAMPPSLVLATLEKQNKWSNPK